MAVRNDLQDYDINMAASVMTNYGNLTSVMTNYEYTTSPITNYKNMTSQPMSNASFQDNVTSSIYDEPFMKLTRKIHLAISPVILVFGVFFNLLTLVVLYRMKIRYQVHTYLAALACSDIVVQIANQTYWLILIGSEGRIVLTDFIDCNIVNALRLIPSYISSNLLIAISFERVFVLYSTGRPRNIFSRNGRFVTFIIILISFAENWHLLGGLTRDGDMFGIMACVGRNDFLKLYVDIYVKYIQLFLYSFIPLALIIVLNVLIVIKVVSSARKINPMKEMKLNVSSKGQASSKANGSKSSNENSARITTRLDIKPVKSESETASIAESKIVASPASQTMSSAAQTAAGKRRDRTTLVVLAVCATHVVLVTPYFVSFSIRSLPRSTSLGLANIFGLLLYMNHAINLVLYCMVGEAFRGEMMKVFRGVGNTCRNMFQ